MPKSKMIILESIAVSKFTSVSVLGIVYFIAYKILRVSSTFNLLMTSILFLKINFKSVNSPKNEGLSLFIADNVFLEPKKAK